MSEGGLADAVDGGFFRCCQRRDWSQPLTEKVLDSNAGLARNYLEAGQLMGRADYLAAGERTIDALVRDFLDEESGLLHGAIDADDDYYALDAAGRVTRQPPRRSGRFLADGNARAVSALLKAGAVLGRTDLTETALRVAENLLRRLWRPGHGMYHFADAGGRHLPGRLRDQAETARAVLHVLQYVDDRRFLAPLEDLIATITSAHVTAAGDFADRDATSSTAVTRSTEKGILDGAVAAEVLLRSAIFLSRPPLAELARRALELHAGDFRRYGYAMAAYGRSVELLLHPPLHVVVLGRADDDRAEALLRAASATYLPSRVVQRLDPVHDAAQVERLGLPARDVPTTYVFLARDCAGEHTDPVDLRTALLEANARRLRG